MSLNIDFCWTMSVRVRFTSDCSRSGASGEPPVGAKSRREQMQRRAVPFDHLISAVEQRRWHFEAECFCRPKVDDQLIFGRRLHR